MQATAQQQDSLAHNLAHALKPGYQREVLRFEASSYGDDLRAPATSMYTDFSQGTMEFTGNHLDLALSGPGYFAVQGPTGPLYTRNGAFQMNANGQLVTMEGLPVIGVSGQIDLPPGSLEINVLANGSIIADGVELDQLRIVTFQNPGDLQRAGSTYFQAPTNAPTIPDGAAVFQGYKELSNSTLVQEMVQMIAGVRQFEAAQRALRTISDAVAFNTHPLTS